VDSLSFIFYRRPHFKKMGFSYGRLAWQGAEALDGGEDTVF
jgi:hypothetical protein